MSYKDVIHKAMNFSGLMAIAHFLNRKKPKILMFHRISEGLNESGIGKELFEKQIKYLAKHFDVISVKQMVEELRCGVVHNNAVAITFDDGHDDFYTVAWPTLKRYGLSATLYITTGFVDKKCWLWPDALRYIVENTKVEFCSISRESNRKIDLSCSDSAWNKLADHALSMKVSERDQFLKKIANDLKVSLPDHPVEPYLGCTWGQLREMVSEGLDVGSHSITHPILSTLRTSELEEELVGSGEKIREKLGFFPVGICYPNGTPQDISAKVIDVASKAGYQYGLMAYPCGLSKNRIMTLGRYPAPTNFNLFQRVMNGVSRSDQPKDPNQ